MGRIGLKKGAYPLNREEETIAFGVLVAQSLPKIATLALTGSLGAGKTTFVKGLAKGLKIKEVIQSPTFVLMNQYEGFTHFDLYRLKSCEDFLKMGFDEHFENQLCVIEWPQIIEEILPSNTIRIHFKYDGQKRIAEVS